MKHLFIILSFLFLGNALFAQKMTPQQYIDKYKNEAIRNMTATGIPASITLSQGMLESGNGNSELARKGKNHFGIKCHSDWRGKTMRVDDDKKNECFRKYNSVLESYKDHALFLSGKQRYAFLFQLRPTDYKGWAKGLKKAGYATNPKYPSLLINIIERYGLNQFDTQSYTGSSANYTDNNTTSIHRLNDIKYINGLKSIIVLQDESIVALALELGMKERKIRKFNELGKGDEGKIGQLIYLEAKNKRATKSNEFHLVKQGETIYSIAQQYGIKTTSLLRKNNMWLGSNIAIGEKIYLRNRKPLNGKKWILGLFRL